MKLIAALLLTAVASSSRAEPTCSAEAFDSAACAQTGPAARAALAGNAATLSAAFTMPSRVLGRDVGVVVSFDRAAAPLAGVFACAQREIGDPGDGYSEIVPAATLTVAPGTVRVSVDGVETAFPVTGTALRLHDCAPFTGATPFYLSPARAGGVFVELPVADRDEHLRVSVELLTVTGEVAGGALSGYGETTTRVNSSLVRRIDRGYSFLEHFAPQRLTLR